MDICDYLDPPVNLESLTVQESSETARGVEPLIVYSTHKDEAINRHLETKFNDVRSYNERKILVVGAGSRIPHTLLIQAMILGMTSEVLYDKDAVPVKSEPYYNQFRKSRRRGNAKY